MICVVDLRRHALHPNVCDPCRSTTRIILRDIIDLYALLPAHLEPSRGQGQRVSGSRTAPVPPRLDIVDLTLPARQGSRGPFVRGQIMGMPGPPSADQDTPIWEADDQIGHLSTATMLDTSVRDWASIRGEHLPNPTVTELVGWLINRLDWACDEHPAVDECVAEWRDLRATLRAAADRPGRYKYIGDCPTLLEDGPCRARLAADPWADAIVCPRCGQRWGRVDWPWLGRLIKESA